MSVLFIDRTLEPLRLKRWIFNGMNSNTFDGMNLGPKRAISREKKKIKLWHRLDEKGPISSTDEESYTNKEIKETKRNQIL